MTIRTPKPAGYGRADKYPEHLVGRGNYRDTGCDIAPACLSCPLPRCRYDMPPGRKVEERNAQVAARRNDGAKMKQIAAEFNISPRTVSRVLQKTKGQA